MAFGDIIQNVGDNAESVTSLPITISAAVAGNLLVYVHFTGDGDSQAPSGFAEAVAVTDGSNADQGAIYYKIAVGGETSVAAGSSAADENMGVLMEIEGPWESSTLDVTATNGPTSEANTSSGTTATTAQADEVAVAGITVRDPTIDQFSGWSNSYIQQGDESSTAKSLATATKLLTSTVAAETSADHDTAIAMGMIATFKKLASDIDTRSKRFSMLTFAMHASMGAMPLFETDGSVDLDDKQQALGFYGGVAWTDPGANPPDLLLSGRQRGGFNRTSGGFA